MFFPLRVKLALLASALLVAGITTVSLLLLDQSSAALEAEARKRGRFLAQSLARNAREAVLLEDDLVLTVLLDTVGSEAEVLMARLLDSRGDLIASSRPGPAGPQPRLTSGSGEMGVTTAERTSASGSRELLIGARISFRDVDLGEAQVALDLDRIVGSVLEEARSRIVVASGALLLLGVAIAFAMSGRITQPLRALHMAVRALAAGDTSAQVAVTTHDELGELTHAFNEMSRGLNEKRRIESAFRRYVSDHVLQQVVERPEAVQLLGERREVTVLFIDIRGFTQLASWIGPERLVAYLNEAFELITNRLLEHGATVDKYIGDAIIAYFGAPIDSSDHAQRAVASAISVQRSIGERNKKYEASVQPFERLDVGIGIQTGPVVLGNIGSEFKMDYTVIGDAVNVANRLQTMAEAGQILITDDVASRLHGRVELSDLGSRQLRNREEPIHVYDVPY